MGSIKKALKKIEKPFRSGRSAAKKTAAKAQERQRNIFERYQKEGLEDIRKLRDYDVLAESQPYQQAYRQYQDQAYADLAKQLGIGGRDTAIQSAGRLGALSGQRARTLGEEERAAREAAGALGAEAFQFGFGAAGDEADRRRTLAADLKTGIDTSGIDRAESRVAAGARGRLAGVTDKVAKGFLGLNEGGPIYANPGFAALLAQLAPQAAGAAGAIGLEGLANMAVGGQAIDPASGMIFTKQGTGEFVDAAGNYASDDQLANLTNLPQQGGQQGGIDPVADAERTRQMLLGNFNKGGYAMMVRHESIRR